MPTNDPRSYGMFGPLGAGPGGVAPGYTPPPAATPTREQLTSFGQLPATPDTQGSVFNNDMMRSQQPFNFSPEMLRMIMGSLPELRMMGSLPGGGSFSFGAQPDPRGGMPMMGGRAGMPFGGGELGVGGQYQPGNPGMGERPNWQAMIDLLRRF